MLIFHLPLRGSILPFKRSLFWESQQTKHEVIIPSSFDSDLSVGPSSQAQSSQARLMGTCPPSHPNTHTHTPSPPTPTSLPISLHVPLSWPYRSLCPCSGFLGPACNTLSPNIHLANPLTDLEWLSKRHLLLEARLCPTFSIPPTLPFLSPRLLATL